MTGIDMSAFSDEMLKIAETQARASGSPWASTTIGAPRTSMPNLSTAKAPTTPGGLGARVVKPAAGFGKRPNYAQPTATAPPETAPAQQAHLRAAPPPNVVFGGR